MNISEVMDTTGAYTYGLDLSNIKFDLLPKGPAKRYICVDLEMTEFTASQRCFVPGANGEVIQFGAVMLDENFNLISKFSSYVKPAYSRVTPVIHELTGITNEALEGADDFLTVFDKFNYWRGEGDITTFCWSKADHKQLWNELSSKARHRYDLFATLKKYVDLQEIFGNLIASKTSVSLESAMKLLQMEYKGQVHTALSDSFNTARILHKLICTDALDLDLYYLDSGNKNNKEVDPKYKSPSENFSCSFASFMSPDLLAQFGHDTEEAEAIEPELNDEEEGLSSYELELLESSPLKDNVNNQALTSLLAKYKIPFEKWLTLATETMNTEEMKCEAF